MVHICPIKPKADFLFADPIALSAIVINFLSEEYGVADLAGGTPFNAA
ncbi:hypothetical protein [Paraburkholderia sp. UCT31]|nr:hypothetical protein [Paraburkholderia sp. UCT31]